MCTFLISNNNFRVETLQSELKKGGPDHTSIITYDKYSFIHNLLWITSPKTTQPYETSKYDFYLLGEMYNWDKTLSSELENIASLYETYGDSFVNNIDGEFLIIIVNKDTLEIDFFSDPWSTRQCWFYQEDDFWCFSTFKYSDKAARMPHNSHCRWDGNTFHLINGCLRLWDLSKHKDSLKDIHKALEDAVVKRWHKDSVLLLSGGTDSSTIAVALQKYGLPTTCVSFDLTANREESDNISKIKQHANIHNYIFLDDLSSQTLTNDIVSRISDLGKRVCMTGNDYDGVYENYRHKPKVQTPNMFSSFPDDLSTIFPWHHFNSGIVRKICDVWETAYLKRAIEVRNCYLDKNLVQEFLWLNSSLKNIRPKHFLRSYLEQHNVNLEFKTIGYKAHMSPT